MFSDIFPLLSDPLTLSNELPKRKGDKRSAILRDEGIRNCGGFSATDFYRSEMGYQPASADWRVKSTARNKRQKSENKVVVTECEDANSRKADGRTEEGTEIKSENRLMLWQFVSVLVNQTCAPSATVTFKNCKKGANCSRGVAASTKTDSLPPLETRKTNAEEQLKNEQFEQSKPVSSKSGKKSKPETKSSKFNILSNFNETSGINLKVSAAVLYYKLKLTSCSV